jgi:hypothetical protein
MAAEEALAYCDPTQRACVFTLRGQSDALPMLAPADAAEASRRLFYLYVDAEAAVAAYPHDDARRAGWAQCHQRLIALAGEHIHAVDARTGESAPLGVALRLHDLRFNAPYYALLLGEPTLSLLARTLSDCLERMCQCDEERRRHYRLMASLLRCQPARYRRTASLARGGQLLYAVFLRQRLDFLALRQPTNDRYVEEDLLSFAPTPDDVRAAVCPHTGHTLLHWAALNRGCAGWATRRALALACAAHALMQRLGADPCAVNREGETPLELALKWPAATPLVETLRLGMADVRARRLALAMGAHPRLGAASPLLALEPGVLALILHEVGVGERLARSPMVDYAARLRCVLRSDHDGLEVPLLGRFAGAFMDGAVRRRRALTPRLRQRLLLGAQLDEDDDLEWEVRRTFFRLRRVRRRLRLPGGQDRLTSAALVGDGTAHAFFDALREVARRQVARGQLPSLRRLRAAPYC